MAYNILIVDDSSTVRSVLGKALGLSGIPLGGVFQAENGLAALGVLRKEWVDLVFVDVNMPVMGGLQLLREMKADDQLRDVPVIIVSTEGSATRIAELEAMGSKGFVRKPFTPESIKNTIEKALGG